jgi:class 3 adenylate cyclase
MQKAAPSGGAAETADDVAWAAETNVRQHTVFGFARPELESRYVAFALNNVSTIISITVSLICLTLIVVVVTGGALHIGRDGWATPVDLATRPVEAVIIAAMLVNRYKNPAPAVDRARLQDLLGVTVAGILIVVLFHGRIERDGECVQGSMRDAPERDDTARRYECARMSGFEPFVLFILATGCNFRLKWLLPIFALSIVATFVPLAYLTHPGLYNERQLAARALLVVALFAVVAVAAVVMETMTRESFVRFKNIARHTQESKATAEQINRLLAAMLPPSILARIADGDERIFDVAKTASVSFSDIVSFTKWGSTRSSEAVVQLVSTMVAAYDAAVHECHVAKVKTIGDAYWAISGLPEHTDKCASRICDFALCQQELLVELNKENPEWGGISIRVGCHTGPLTGGVIGTQQLSYEVFGETNDIAEQFEQNGPHGGVLVSEKTMQMAITTNRFDFAMADIKVDGIAAFVATRRNAAGERRSIIEVKSATSVPMEAAAVLTYFDAEPVDPPLAKKRSLFSMSVPRNALLESSGFLTRDQLAAAAAVAVEDELATKSGCCGITSTFARQEVEEDYYDFDVEQKHRVRQVAAGSLGTLTVAYAAAALVELPPARYGEAALAVALLLVCAALAFAGAVVCRRAEFTRRRFRVYWGVYWLLMVAITLSVAQLPPTMFLSNPWYLGGGGSAFCLTSPPADVHGGFTAVLALAAYLAIAAVNIRLLSLSSQLVFAVMVAAAVLVWLVVVQAPHDRARFAVKKRADAAAAAAEAEEALRRQLLGHMAPAHVQGDMVALVSTDEFRAGRPAAITHTLANVTVVFCKVRTDTDATTAASMYDDIAGTTQRVEECLAGYPLLVKIKTVGSTLVVAGPITVDATDADQRSAATQAVLFANAVVRGPRGLAVRVGLCTGPVVATVMGTDRIAFDIFGDTVNTASRCMSTAPVATAQMAAAAWEAVHASDAAGELPPADIVDVLMKGKGDVAVARFTPSAMEDCAPLSPAEPASALVPMSMTTAW